MKKTFSYKTNGKKYIVTTFFFHLYNSEKSSQNFFTSFYIHRIKIKKKTKRTHKTMKKNKHVFNGFSAYAYTYIILLAIRIMYMRVSGFFSTRIVVLKFFFVLFCVVSFIIVEFNSVLHGVITDQFTLLYFVSKFLIIYSIIRQPSAQYNSVPRLSNATNFRVLKLTSCR